MATPRHLHRNDLTAFKGWLEAKGHQILEPIGDYEVLRWMGVKGQPMPMLFRTERNPEWLTVSVGAMSYVQKWRSSLKRG